MRKTYLFRPSLPGLLFDPDLKKPTRRVKAQNEAGARGRLGNAGPGRSWTLVEVILPPEPEPIEHHSTMIMPVMLNGDYEAVIGFAEVRSDGTIDLTLNQIRVKEPNPPKSLRGFTHVSVNLTYRGLCAHKRKA